MKRWLIFFGGIVGAMECLIISGLLSLALISISSANFFVVLLIGLLVFQAAPFGAWKGIAFAIDVIDDNTSDFDAFLYLWMWLIAFISAWVFVCVAAMILSRLFPKIPPQVLLALFMLQLFGLGFVCWMLKKQKTESQS